MPPVLHRIKTLLRRRPTAATNGVEITPARNGAPAPALPVPTSERPRILVVLDVENLVSTIHAAGCQFDPVRIHERVREIGVPVLVFAVGNLEAIAPRHRELLTLAGFSLLHCERLRNGTESRKDVVDSHIHALVHRILPHAPGITTVVLATDDQDFAALITAIRDLGRRCVILTPRHGGALAQIAETVHLPIAVATARAPHAWCPDVAIAALRDAARAGAGTSAAQQAVTRLQLLAPMPTRILKRFLRRFRRTFGADLVGKGKLLSCLESSVPTSDRDALPDGALAEFLGALIAADVIAHRKVHSASRTSGDRYAPDWWNPFCRDGVADLIEAEAQEREGATRTGATNVA